jgi:hypothetical protein
MQRKKPNKKPSTRGALIKGMSLRLPSEILSNPVFKKGLKQIMKGYAGIYALYDNHKLYYVGLTTNLFGRINWHQRDRHKGRWNNFVIFRIKRVRLLKDIETLITHVADLPGNRVKGRVPKDNDINRVLRDILRDHEKEIKGIKNALRRKPLGRRG